MKGRARSWLPDSELVEAVIRAGSVNAYAEGAEIPEPTLRSHLRRGGLLAKVQEGLRAPVPAVVDPEARKQVEREAELKRLRKENDQLTTALVDQEALFDRMVEAAKLPVEKPTIKPRPPRKDRPLRSVIAPLYDLQFGQFVRPTDTPGGRGNFSTEVFDTRLARWVEGVCGNVADYTKSHRVEEFILPLGGDLVEGDEIFAGQAWQLELDPCQQVWELAGKLEVALRHVVRFAREEAGAKFVALYGITGNHGKVGGKRGGARPATYNWDWLVLKLLADKLRAEPIDQAVIEPGGALFFYCAGHEFQMVHGQEVRGWGGLPFYGLSKHDGKSIRLHNRMYRYLLMGHHHQSATIPNGAGETIVSGDFVGPNNLSGAITAGSRPQQSVLFVASKWGITEQARIYFQTTEAAYASSPIHGQAP